MQSSRNIDEIYKHGKEALYYHTKNKITYCDLCPNFCIIKPNARGICKNKINIKAAGGIKDRIFALELISLGADRIGTSSQLI